jgi:hypothetical protein
MPAAGHLCLALAYLGLSTWLMSNLAALFWYPDFIVLFLMVGVLIRPLTLEETVPPPQASVASKMDDQEFMA